MKSILLIAWRNIWRQRLRSAVVIASLTVGIWAGVFVSAFNQALNDQRTQNIIANQLSHLQFHHPRWSEQNEVAYWLPQAESIAEVLQRDDAVAHFSERVLATGMIASAHYTAGVQIAGVDPEREMALTGLKSKVDSGAYLDTAAKNSLLLGQALAAKLEVRPGSRVVLTFTNGSQQIVSAAFKVAGLYREFSSQLEELRVYVPRSKLLALLSASAERRHEIAVRLKDPEGALNYAAKQQSAFPEALVQSWQALGPDLAYADAIMTKVLYLIMAIIMLALSFGIVNTMLMAVLERRRELGMLMSVGMSKKKVFAMILTETFFLALLGGPLGIMLGYLSVVWTGSRGVALHMFSEGLASYGIDTVIYPAIDTSFYWGTGALVMGMTLFAAIFPAFQALKLNPVETLRSH